MGELGIGNGIGAAQALPTSPQLPNLQNSNSQGIRGVTTSSWELGIGDWELVSCSSVATSPTNLQLPTPKGISLVVDIKHPWELGIGDWELVELLQRCDKSIPPLPKLPKGSRRWMTTKLLGSWELGSGHWELVAASSVAPSPQPPTPNPKPIPVVVTTMLLGSWELGIGNWNIGGLLKRCGRVPTSNSSNSQRPTGNPVV
jgi:hypothetical protein